MERATVDQPTLYRHFPSKAQLFEATIVSSLREFLDRHFDYWRSRPPGADNLQALAQHFVTGLFDVLEPHRASLRLLLVTPEGDERLGKVAATVSHQFTSGLVVLRQVVVDEARAQGYHGIDAPDATIGAITGMVLAMALFDDWIFPAGERPAREIMLAEATRLMLHGVAHRPVT